jgi:hypothetical protein
MLQKQNFIAKSWDITLYRKPHKKKGFKISSCASKGDENEIDQKLGTYTT